MCLRTTYKNPKIATQDIVCYKVCCNTTNDDVVMTPYQHMGIKLGVTYIDTKDLTITPSDTSEYIITAGVFHSFKKRLEAEIELLDWNKYIPCGYSVVKCIIPKGSEYFPGTFGCGHCDYESYGSKQIKLIEKIK